MTLKSDREYRAFRPVEVRAAEGDGVVVGGYAAVFGQSTRIGDYWEELIAPGAFGETLQRRGVKGAADDVIFVLNHNDNLLLARTRSGTLSLRQDDKGLYMETTLDPVDPDAIRVMQKMKRGDLDKMSFAFRATAEEWVERTGDIPLRTIKAVELFDVSVVTDPAYDGTDISLRNADAVLKARHPSQDIAARAAQARMRMKHGLRTRQLSA